MKAGRCLGKAGEDQIYRRTDIPRKLDPTQAPFLAVAELCLKSCAPLRRDLIPNGEAMSFEHLSTNQPSLFTEPESASPPPAPRVKSARSTNRAAWWEQDLSRTATYLMGQARNDGERAFVERLYEEAMAEGPDFINYRSKSAFLAAPKLGIDRNAYARILNALEAIERGTYRSCREKGKQGRPAHRGARAQGASEPRPAVRRGPPFPRRHRAPGLRLQADRGQRPQAPVAVRLRHRSPAHQADPHAARPQGGAGHQRLHHPGAPGARRDRPAHVQAGIRV